MGARTIKTSPQKSHSVISTVTHVNPVQHGMRHYWEERINEGHFGVIVIFFSLSEIWHVVSLLSFNCTSKFYL